MTITELPCMFTKLSTTPVLLCYHYIFIDTYKNFNLSFAPDSYRILTVYILHKKIITMLSGTTQNRVEEEEKGPAR